MSLKGKFCLGSIILVIILTLIGIIGIQYNQISSLNEKYWISISNNKAYEAQNDSLVNQSREFQLTIEQLNYSADSLVQKLNEARKQLNIKDKNIKELEYIASNNSKTDTVHLKDTIFIKDTVVDTLISDEWSRLKLHLEYPNEIVANYSFKNSTIIVASSKKETVNPPKKFFICRWFQKKHEVISIDVVEENPYCELKEQKFIKIVK